VTPAFYTHIIYYQSFQDALLAETLAVNEENRTANITDAGNLCSFLAQAEVDNICTQNRDLHRCQQKPESLVDRLAWTLIPMLRGKPIPASYPQGFPQARAKVMSLEELRLPQGHVLSRVGSPSLNFLDVFVRHSCGLNEQRTYRRAVLRTILARRIALGSVSLLWSYRLILKGLSAAAVVRAVVWAVGKAPHEQAVGSWIWQGPVSAFLLCVGWSWLDSCLS